MYVWQSDICLHFVPFEKCHLAIVKRYFRFLLSHKMIFILISNVTVSNDSHPNTRWKCSQMFTNVANKQALGFLFVFLCILVQFVMIYPCRVLWNSLILVLQQNWPKLMLTHILLLVRRIGWPRRYLAIYFEVWQDFWIFIYSLFGAFSCITPFVICQINSRSLWFVRNLAEWSLY